MEEIMEESELYVERNGSNKSTGQVTKMSWNRWYKYEVLMEPKYLKETDFGAHLTGSA